MDSLAKYFWLFFTEPAKFTYNWLANTNNVQKSLFPVSLLCMISTLFLYGLNVFYSAKKPHTSKEIIKIIIKYLLHLCLYLSYFPLLTVLSDKNILESFIFGFIISGFILLSLLLLVMFSMLLSYLFERLAKSLALVTSQSMINSEDRKKSSSCNPVGLIFAITCIFYFFTIANSTIVSTSIFFSFSWWLIIFLSIIYCILNYIFSCAITIFFSGTGKSKSSS